MYTHLITLLKLEFVGLWHRIYDWLLPLGFFLVILLLFPLIFSPQPLFLKKYISSYIWLAALFTSLFSALSLFHAELEDGYLEQILLSRIPLPIILLIKSLAYWICTQLPIVILSWLIALFFGCSFYHAGIISLSLLFGTPTLSLLSFLMMGLSLGLEQPGALLGILILPLTMPILIFGTLSAEQAALSLSPIGGLSFLAGISILAITVLPLIIALSLRINLSD